MQVQRFVSRLFTVFIAMTLLVGCARDPLPASLLSALPVPDGADVELGAAIRFAFASPMAREATEGAIEFKPTVICVFTWPDDVTLVCTPAEALAADTEYTVTVSTEARTRRGGRLKEPISLAFKTQALPEAPAEQEPPVEQEPPAEEPPSVDEPEQPEDDTPQEPALRVTDVNAFIARLPRLTVPAPTGASTGMRGLGVARGFGENSEEPENPEEFEPPVDPSPEYLLLNEDPQLLFSGPNLKTELAKVIDGTSQYFTVTEMVLDALDALAAMESLAYRQKIPAGDRELISINRLMGGSPDLYESVAAEDSGALWLEPTPTGLDVFWYIPRYPVIVSSDDSGTDSGSGPADDHSPWDDGYIGEAYLLLSADGTDTGAERIQLEMSFDWMGEAWLTFFIAFEGDPIVALTGAGIQASDTFAYVDQIAWRASNGVWVGRGSSLEFEIANATRISNAIAVEILAPQGSGTASYWQHEDGRGYDYILADENGAQVSFIIGSDRRTISGWGAEVGDSCVDGALTGSQYPVYSLPESPGDYYVVCPDAPAVGIPLRELDPNSGSNSAFDPEEGDSFVAPLPSEVTLARGASGSSDGYLKLSLRPFAGINSSSTDLAIDGESRTANLVGTYEVYWVDTRVPAFGEMWFEDREVSLAFLLAQPEAPEIWGVCGRFVDQFCESWSELRTGPSVTDASIKNLVRSTGYMVGGESLTVHKILIAGDPQPPFNVVDLTPIEDLRGLLENPLREFRDEAESLQYDPLDVAWNLLRAVKLASDPDSPYAALR